MKYRALISAAPARRAAQLQPAHHSVATLTSNEISSLTMKHRFTLFALVLAPLATLHAGAALPPGELDFSALIPATVHRTATKRHDDIRQKFQLPGMPKLLPPNPPLER